MRTKKQITMIVESFGFILNFPIGDFTRISELSKIVVHPPVANALRVIFNLLIDCRIAHAPAPAAGQSIDSRNDALRRGLYCMRVFPVPFGDRLAVRF